MMVMVPESVSAVITNGDDGLVGTPMWVDPAEVCALTWYAVGPGGSTIVMLPAESLTRTNRGTRTNVSDTSPLEVVAMTGEAARAVAVTLPELVVKSTLPLRFVATTSPAPVVKLTPRRSPLAVTFPALLLALAAWLVGTATV